MLGLTLFAVVAITGLASGTSGSGLISSSAHARFYEVEPATSELAVAFALGRIPPATARQQVAALSSLALSFATLFAFNLWFWRHVRLVHAKDRRRRG